MEFADKNQTAHDPAGPGEAGWRTGRCVGAEPFVEGNDEG
jgi:hypothetical protein